MKRGGGMANTLTDESSALDNQTAEEDVPDSQAGDVSISDMKTGDSLAADMKNGDGGISAAQTGDGSVLDDQETAGSMPDGQEDADADSQAEEGNVQKAQPDTEDGMFLDGQAEGETETDLEKQLSESDASGTEGEAADSAASDKKSETAEPVVITDNSFVEDELGLSNDELFEGYLTKIFYGDYGTDTYSLGLENELNKLDEEEKKLYAELKDKITDIAEGRLNNTEFTFEKDFYSSLTANTENLLKGKIKNLVMLLLSDCPFELYWFNKVKGYSYSYARTSDGKYTLNSLAFTVAADYGTNYAVNAANVERAKKAASNAAKIVEDNKQLSDYEKLKAYKEKICDLNAYNHSAASAGAGNGKIDPWQLVYVFDGDDTTNVVCEGYSKAFAYLCELSRFKSEKIRCYLVTGSIGGNHMWNIVTMENGLNYLADVTNCDYDENPSIGYPDKLFLAGTPVSGNGSYTFQFDALNKITFTYDADTKNLYPASILQLADKNYEPPVQVGVSFKNKQEGEGGYPVSYTYDGSPLAAPVLENFDITVTGTENEIKWEPQFQWYQGDQTSESADLENSRLETAPADAGTYTLAAEISAQGYDASAETRILIQIKKAAVKPEWLKVRLPGDGSVYYTGSPHKAEVTGTGTAGGLEAGQIRIKYQKDGEQQLLEEAADIGSYRVIVTISGNSNLNDVENLDTGRTFEIKKFVPENARAEVTPATDALNWARAVTLAAPEGYLISLSLEGEFQNQVSWDRENLTEDEGRKNQTKISYYLKQAASGAVCTEPLSVYAYIDRTAPDFEGSGDGIHIEESTQWWKTLLTTITFGYYKQNNVTIQAGDALSGVKEYYYYIDKPDDAQSGSARPALTKEALDEIAKEGKFQKTENGALTAAENQASVIYAYALDYAGNQSEYICSEGIIRDTAAPSLQVSVENDKISDTSVTFTVSASENADGYYLVKKTNETAPAGMDDFASYADGAYTPLDGVTKTELSISGNTETVQNLSSNTAYYIYMTAADRAGNVSEISRTEFTTKKKFPVFTEGEIPVITGIYGEKISEMKLSEPEQEGTVKGSWEIVPGQDQIPVAGDTGRYQIQFVPEDTDTYECYVTDTSAEVKPKPVTIKILDASCIYGEPEPEFQSELTEGSELAAGDEQDGLKISLTAQTEPGASPGTYTITGKAENPNYEVTFLDGTLTIRKKPAGPLAGSPQQRSYPSASGSGGNLELINIKEKLPDDAGAVDGYALEVTGSSPQIVKQHAVSADGELSYQIAPGAAGSSAVIRVTADTANYESLYYEVIVTLSDKLHVTADGIVTASPDCRLVYGDRLSEVIFEDISFTAESTGEHVPGRLEVQEPDFMPQAGTSEIGWVFTPDDTDTYDIKTGTAKITVARRTVIIENKDYETDYSYTGGEIQKPEASQFAVKGLVDGDGWEPSAYMKFTWYQGETDTEDKKIQGPPAEAGNYVLKAGLEQSRNYAEAYLLVAVKIAHSAFQDAVLEPASESADSWYCSDVAIVPPKGHLISADREIWHQKIHITQDRKGAYRYYLKQESTGSVSEEKQITVNRDTVPPTGSVTAAGSMWDRFLETITFGLYTRSEDIVTIQAEDAASGMDGGKIEYYIADDTEVYEGEAGKADLERLPKESWKITQNQARITKNRGNIVYVRLTDLAGNMSYLSTDIIIHDDVSPELILRPDGQTYTDILGSANAYRERVTYTVQAGDSGSEVKKLSIQLDGKEIRSQKEEKSVEIETPGVHLLSVTAEDMAGNEMTKTEQFRIYGTYVLELAGGPSVYDGQPLVPGTDFTVSRKGSGEVRYFYSKSEEGEQTEGLPVNAGRYWIHVYAAEDTEHCYMPQYAVSAYEIKPDDTSGSKPGGGSGSGSDGDTGNGSGSGSGGGSDTDSKPGSGSGNSSGSGNGSGSGNSSSSGNGSGSGNNSGSSGSSPGGGSGSGNSYWNGGTGGSPGNGGTSSVPVNTHKTETKPDGTKIETAKQTSPDGTVTETEKQTSPDGTVTETKKQMSSDGTVTETAKKVSPDGTVTETEKQTSPDGTVTETAAKTNPDGTRTQTVTRRHKDGSGTETITETHVSGAKTETVTENASNGTTVKSVTETASDGSVYTAVRSKGFDLDGNTVSRMIVRTIASTGAVTQTVEKSAFTVSQAKAVVTTVKNSGDEIVKAVANVTMQGVFSKEGSMLNLSGFMTDRIAKEAGTQDVQITVSVKNDKNALLYKLTVDNKNLSSGSGLYVYGYDAGTKTYSMVSAAKCTVSDAKSISIRVPDKRNYVLLNTAQKKQADQAILKTIRLAKTSQTLPTGGKAKISLSEKANTQSISKITYTSSDKKTAAVTKNGTVKAKSRGTVRIQVKVKMKNGKTKILAMKMKVR